jgi:hypothetical protein
MNLLQRLKNAWVTNSNYDLMKVCDVLRERGLTHKCIFKLLQERVSEADYPEFDLRLRDASDTLDAIRDATIAWNGGMEYLSKKYGRE